MSDVIVLDYWLQFKPIDYFWHLVMAFFYIFICFFAVVANMMVIYYLMRVKKKGRQDGSYFLLNLAVADTMKVVFGIPMVVVSSFYGEWVFGKAGCTYYGVSGGIFGFCSLATLCLMAIERYVIVNNPFLIISKKTKITCVAITWGYAAFWSTLQLGSKNGYVLEGFLTSSSFDYISRDPYSRFFMGAMICGGFFLPLFLLCLFLWLTKRTLVNKQKDFGGAHFYVISKKSKNKSSRSNQDSSGGSHSTDMSGSEDESKSNSNSTSLAVVVPPKQEAQDGAATAAGEEPQVEITGLTKATATATATATTANERNSAGTSSDATEYESKDKHFRRRQNRVLKTIFSNLIFFVIAWTPYALTVIYAQYGSNIESYINPFTTSLPALLSKTSSIYNPIMYTLNNQDCKKYFKRALFA